MQALVRPTVSCQADHIKAKQETYLHLLCCARPTIIEPSDPVRDLRLRDSRVGFIRKASGSIYRIWLSYIPDRPLWFLLFRCLDALSVCRCTQRWEGSC
jgi:hypothetical protein